MAEATIPRELPSPEELDLANYLIGTYLSEISDFGDRLEWIKGDPMTVEEYLERKEAGDTFGPRVPLDRDQLAHIIAFATDALQDADAVREYAEKLQEAAFALYRDQDGPDEGRDHYRRVREWHLAEASNASRKSPLCSPGVATSLASRCRNRTCCGSSIGRGGN